VAEIGTSATFRLAESSAFAFFTSVFFVSLLQAAAKIAIMRNKYGSLFI